MSSFVGNLIVFGRALRGLGLDVHVGRLLDVTEALQHIDVGSRDEVYHTCRALLVHRRDDLEMFDAAFDAFWRDRGSLSDRRDATRVHDTRDADTSSSEAERTSGTAERTARQAVAQPSARGRDEGDSAPAGTLRTWSDVEVIAEKDFAEFTGEEVALARRALDRLVWSPGERRTRHWVAGRGSRCRCSS